MKENKISFNELGIIIAAGGESKRFDSPETQKEKLLADLCGKPVFIHSILNFSDICPKKNIILSANPYLINLFEEELRKFDCGNVKIAEGGETRMNSVYNALEIIPENIKFVAVHDAARPLATANLLRDAFEFAKNYGSSVPAKKIIDSVKRADKNALVLDDIDREGLWIVETPQIFRRDKLMAAYKKAFEDDFETTDDAGVVRYAGHSVRLFENKSRNTKITFYSDLCEIRKNISAKF
jgi:2-C-methyl-D-erythritol 4-phosphate cytidylyltransferase